MTERFDVAIDAVLAAPYARVFRREEEGGYSAEVLELSGCYSAGDDATEAMANLEEAMALWVQSALADGQQIPPPLAATEYAGRISLRLLPSMHERAVLLAAAEGASLNRWLSDAIATYAGEPPRTGSVLSDSSDAIEHVRSEAEFVKAQVKASVRMKRSRATQQPPGLDVGADRP